MQFKLALLALVSSASAAALPQFDESAEIVGGELAAAGDFPFIVSLQRSSGSHFCGGTLVNANTVVTAAHCSVGQTASAVSVRAGSLKRGSGGTVVKVSRIIVHPSYNTGVALNYDVAIWKLATAIPTSSTISYATLAASGSDPASGSSSTVAGWGTTSSGGSSPVDLRKVTVPIVARATCKSQYDASPDYTADDISVNMVCAGYTAGGKDSCQGDSGGPLVNSAKTLIGIVSWGEGCAAPGFPGVYARVGTLRSFIDANL